VTVDVKRLRAIHVGALVLTFVSMFFLWTDEDLASWMKLHYATTGSAKGSGWEGYLYFRYRAIYIYHCWFFIYAIVALFIAEAGRFVARALCVVVLALLSLVVLGHAVVLVCHAIDSERVMIGIAGWCGLLGVAASVGMAWTRVAVGAVWDSWRRHWESCPVPVILSLIVNIASALTLAVLGVPLLLDEIDYVRDPAPCTQSPLVGVIIVLGPVPFLVTGAFGAACRRHWGRVTCPALNLAIALVLETEFVTRIVGRDSTMTLARMIASGALVVLTAACLFSSKTREWFAERSEGRFRRRFGSSSASPGDRR